MGGIRRFVTSAAATTFIIGTAVLNSGGQAAAAACPGQADLTAAFGSRPDGLVGADYQRAIDLPDGRRLWTFQDAFVAGGRGTILVHNVAVIQTGDCFELRHGGDHDRPRSWLGADLTTQHARWFWPLASTLPGDGTVRVFLAEFEERGERYLANSTPVATWVATLDAVTLATVSLEPAPDPSAALYGWSAASDAEHTYLYGHCYRQFGFGFLGHDDCAGFVTVARTSHDLTAPLEYWDGATWVADADAAVNVVPTVAPDGSARVINPTQVSRIGERWVAVTKEGDWWGRSIFVDVATAATGPWTTVAVIDATAANEDENTYFASIVDTATDGIVVGLSHNRWDGRLDDVYRPTFTFVPLPATVIP